MLGGFKIGMPQHFTNGFYWDAVSEGNLSRKGMPDQMGGQVFGNACEVCEPFDVRIHFLVAEHGSRFFLSAARDLHTFV